MRASNVNDVHITISPFQADKDKTWQVSVVLFNQRTLCVLGMQTM